MREIFTAELTALGEDLAAMSRLVESAVGAAGTSLLEANLPMAEAVIADDHTIDALERSLDERCVALLAQQQPVARDLRIVVSALRMSASLERMGDLARHIAEVARGRYPAVGVPEPLVPTFTGMHEAAVRVSRQVTNVLQTRDLELAQAIEDDDDRLDKLHADTFAATLTAGHDLSPQEIVDITLCGRYYERFGDHAVSVARRIVYLVTGDFADERGAI